MCIRDSHRRSGDEQCVRSFVRGELTKSGAPGAASGLRPAFLRGGSGAALHSEAGQTRRGRVSLSYAPPSAFHISERTSMGHMDTAAPQEAPSGKGDTIAAGARREKIPRRAFDEQSRIS